MFTSHIGTLGGTPEKSPFGQPTHSSKIAWTLFGINRSLGVLIELSFELWFRTKKIWEEIMITAIATAWLFCVAIFLELADRAPAIDC